MLGLLLKLFALEESKLSKKALTRISLAVLFALCAYFLSMRIYKETHPITTSIVATSTHTTTNENVDIVVTPPAVTTSPPPTASTPTIHISSDEVEVTGFSNTRLLEWLSYIGTIAVFIRTLFTRILVPGTKSISKLAKVMQQIDEMSLMLKPNGGSSLYDMIVRVDSRIAASEARHHDLVDSLHIVRFESDAHGKCLWVSHAYKELTGLTQDTSAHDGWVTALHPDDRAKVFNEWQDAVTQSRDFRLQYRMLNVETGDENLVLCRGLRMLRGKEVIGYVGTILPLSGPYAEKHKTTVSSIH